MMLAPAWSAGLRQPGAAAAAAPAVARPHTSGSSGVERPSAGSLCLAASALGYLTAAVGARRRQLRMAKRVGRASSSLHAGATSAKVPTDFYGLLGLPRFGASREDVRKAYHRVVKLVHPDVLGGDTKDLTSLVTVAYKTLTDEAQRVSYDEYLQIHDPVQSYDPVHVHDSGAVASAVSSDAQLSKRNSTWAPGSPSDARPVFVNECQCVMCVRCVECAPETFVMDYEGTGRARVFQQCGDDLVDIDWAIEACPTAAISYVDREDLPLLELFMPDCVQNGHADLQRSEYGQSGRSHKASPWDLMRMFRNGGTPKRNTVAWTDSWVESRKWKRAQRGKLGQQKDPKMVAETIKSAVSKVPSEVVIKVWGELL